LSNGVEFCVAAVKLHPVRDQSCNCLL